MSIDAFSRWFLRSKNFCAAGLASLFWLAAAACSTQSAPPSATSPKIVSEDVYRSLDGMSFIPCSVAQGKTNCGENLYSRPKSSSIETGISLDESSWYDCSDAMFDCIGNTSYLMAVPKASLQRGHIYKVRGMEITVLECFQSLVSREPNCDTALLTARCVETCVCLGSKDSEVGVLYYFTAERGITAFMLTKSVKKMEEAQPARSWSLLADHGFLRRPPPSQKYRSNERPCSF